MLAFLDNAGWESVTAPPVTAAGAAVAALVLIRLVRSARQRMPVITAPRRAFTAAERREGLARSGGRCEYKHPLWRRCRQLAAHADHVYPWSRGGWTARSNLQMLCQRHNLVKGAKPPSRLYLWRLRRRRRRYFPPGAARRIEWRGHRAS
ncbi:HNH endonuclease [Nakamurella multipartita DSM 44233]|uniref:HNH endonuclease n=2 Tax=Nakamurella TaxID=53460 RepID=C8X8N6_NAKMY|nr:HNH endonuclease [Nakamurella multipartita DSM 44233]